MYGFDWLALFAGCFGLANARPMEGPTYLANVSNPVYVGPSEREMKPGTPITTHIPDWPNYRSVEDTFIGRCGVVFTHRSHAACVSAFHWHGCGQHLHLWRMLDNGRVARATDVMVVDLCHDLSQSEVYVTADAFAELGGKLLNKSLPGVRWKFTDEPPRKIQLEDDEKTAIGTMFLSFILWAAGLSLLL